MKNITVKRMVSIILMAVFSITMMGSINTKASIIPQKKILVVAPHEDDECIACAGVIRKAVLDGNDIRIMYVTNGNVLDLADVRIKESIAALKKLGVSKDKIYYLSYGDYNVLDNLRALKDDPTRIFTDMVGYTHTYGVPGVIDDYHYLITGTHANYCRQDIMFDVKSVLNTFRPDDIYLPSAFESSLDHKATSTFITDTILDIKKTSDYSPMLHEYQIYKQGLPQYNLEYNSLPVMTANSDANMDFTSPYSWNDRESLIVPDEMNRLQTNSLKINMVNAGAVYTADSPLSSQNAIAKAFDGDTSTMYISNGTKTNTVITVTFSSAQLVEKIRAMFGDTITYSSTNVTLEAANNTTDLNSKINSYRLLANNVPFDASSWKEINAQDAYNCKVWRFTLHNVGSETQVRIPEIEFYNTNLKANILREFVSQAAGNYDKRSMRDEVFWKRDMSNLAYSASVTASSENAGPEQQLCRKVNDGVILGDGIYKDRADNYSQDVTRREDPNENWANREYEWRTLGETSGAWVQLNWSKPITANRIILYDRPDLDENITGGKLTFSDGSSINIGTLNRNGSGYVINFTTKTFSWVKLTIEKAEGTNTGLAEFEVYKK